MSIWKSRVRNQGDFGWLLGWTTPPPPSKYFILVQRTTNSALISYLAMINWLLKNKRTKLYRATIKCGLHLKLLWTLPDRKYHSLVFKNYLVQVRGRSESAFFIFNILCYLYLLDVRFFFPVLVVNNGQQLFCPLPSLTLH